MGYNSQQDGLQPHFGIIVNKGSKKIRICVTQDTSRK